MCLNWVSNHPKWSDTHSAARQWPTNPEFGDITRERQPLVFHSQLMWAGNRCLLKMQSNFTLTLALMLTNELPAVAETLGLKNTAGKNMNHNQSMCQSIIDLDGSAAECTDTSALSSLELTVWDGGGWGLAWLVNDAVVNWSHWDASRVGCVFAQQE